MMPSVKEPLAGLALLVIFGFLIWYNRPIENPRLSDPYLQGQTPRFLAQDAYEAWLWQDPFGFDPDYGSGGAAETWALTARGRKRDENFSTAVPAGLTCKKSLEKVLKVDEQDAPGKLKPVILAPLLKVAPHTVENKEMHTRQRYAVVAGLVESGYRPLEPGMLHFCSIQENRREYDMRWEHYQHESTSKDSKPEGSKPDIVVAWIDSEILTDKSKFPAGHDCTRRCNFAFKNLLKEISKNNKLYLFDAGNTLDSGRSAQVEKHIQCIQDQNIESAGINGNVGDIQFLKLAGMESKEEQAKCNGEASTATSGQAGKESQGAGKESAGKPTEEPKQCGSKTTTEEAGSKKSASQATGGTGQGGNKKTGSEKLAELLASELTLRGVTHRSQVMTISEQNSDNAATLVDNLRKCLPGLPAKRECVKPEPGNLKSYDGSGAANSFDEIRNVFYLKSLDGKTPGTRDKYGKDKNDKDRKDKDEKDGNESERADKGEKAPSIELRHSPPLPLGSSQLDYFYRLAEEMNNAHHIVDLVKRDSGIRAAVILGSDFHDKLLIIQALREKMPHLLILTTDLDTQMLHPKHWRATRNLVVASHFDLRLREIPNHRDFWERAYQNQFPPFRDSQQTNIFYRTLGIAADGAKGIEESTETFPRIFEVGRNSFVLRETMSHLLILTDLDAQMLHPEHLHFTRNPVVASRFELLLRKIPNNRDFWERAYQNQFPPFRDSQQTNIFYRTLSIAESIAEGAAKSIEDSAETFPRIFEVGRNGFVHLSTAEKNDALDYYHPPNDTRKNTTKELWLLLPIAVSLIVFYWAIRPWSSLFSGYLFFGTSVIFALAFGFGADIFSNNELKERFSFTTERALLFSLVVVFFIGFLWSDGVRSRIFRWLLFFMPAIVVIALGFGTGVFSTNELNEPFSFTPERVLFFFLIAVSLTVFLWLGRAKLRIFRWLFFFTPAIIVMALGFGTDVFSTNESKEPFSFTDGISLWPTLFIQITVILLAGMFIFRAMFELDMNACHLRVRYFFGIKHSAASNEVLTLQFAGVQFAFAPRGGESSPKRSITISLCPNEFESWARRRPYRWSLLGRWLRRSIWDRKSRQVREGFTFLFLILSIAAYAWNDVYPSKFSFLECFGFLLWIVAIVYMPRSWKDVPTRKMFLFIFLIAIAVYALSAAYPLKFPIELFFVIFVGIFFIVCLPHDWNKVSIKHWMQDNGWDPSGQINPERTLWRQYHGYGRFFPRVTRVMAMWLIFAIIETLLIYLLPPWPLPWRGATDPANWTDMAHFAPWIGVISFTVTMLLLFFVLDAVRLNFYWIKKLRTQHPFLTRSVPRRLGYLSMSERLARLENIVSLVAGRTQAVDRLIYYPMLCIILMLLARITYFDNQEFPLSKGITFAVAISFLFFSGFVLRHEANELRNCVKKSLQDLRVNNATQRIDETLDRIDAIDEGAFQPMLEQPVMQALLIILASIGLFAGEYLKVFG